MDLRCKNNELCCFVVFILTQTMRMDAYGTASIDAVSLSVNVAPSFPAYCIEYGVYEGTVRLYIWLKRFLRKIFVVVPIVLSCNIKIFAFS